MTTFTAIPKQIIDKHSAVRDKAVVTDGDEVADESMRLNAASFTNLCSALNLDEVDESVRKELMLTLGAR